MNVSSTYESRGIARDALYSTVCLNTTLLIYMTMLSPRNGIEKLDKAFIAGIFMKRAIDQNILIKRGDEA